jgi:hypothetical protein
MPRNEYVSFIITLFILFSSSSSVFAKNESSNSESLHNSTIQEWSKASYENKISTSTDFVLESTLVKYIAEQDELALSYFASLMVRCIDLAAENTSDVETKTTKVSTLAAKCLPMFQRKRR